MVTSETRFILINCIFVYDKNYVYENRMLFLKIIRPPLSRTFHAFGYIIPTAAVIEHSRGGLEYFMYLFRVLLLAKLLIVNSYTGGSLFFALLTNSHKTVVNMSEPPWLRF